MPIVKPVKLIIWSNDSKKEFDGTINNILIAVNIVQNFFEGGIRIFRVTIEEVE